MSDGKHPFYQCLGKYAEDLKIALQMIIGAAIVVALILKLIFATVCHPNSEIAYLLTSHHPLEIVGYALAISAGIELAYMLFTPGPDEAIDPLILGMASAVLLIISRENIVGYDVALTVLVLTGSIGFLFWIRRMFINKKDVY